MKIALHTDNILAIKIPFSFSIQKLEVLGRVQVNRPIVMKRGIILLLQWKEKQKR